MARQQKAPSRRSWEQIAEEASKEKDQHRLDELTEQLMQALEAEYASKNKKKSV